MIDGLAGNEPFGSFSMAGWETTCCMAVRATTTYWAAQGRTGSPFSGSNGTDTIVDFEHAIDKIQISGYGSALDCFGDLAGHIAQSVAMFALILVRESPELGRSFCRLRVGGSQRVRLYLRVGSARRDSPSTSLLDTARKDVDADAGLRSGQAFRRHDRPDRWVKRNGARYNTWRRTQERNALKRPLAT